MALTSVQSPELNRVEMGVADVLVALDTRTLTFTITSTTLSTFDIGFLTAFHRTGVMAVPSTRDGAVWKQWVVQGDTATHPDYPWLSVSVAEDRPDMWHSVSS